MKKALVLSVYACNLAVGYPVPSAAGESCSNTTLKGSYSYWTHGTYAGNPYAEAGLESYDGRGKVLSTYTDSLNRVNTSDAGTYFLGSDCQGSVTYASGGKFNIYVSPNGDEFTYIPTTGDGVVTGVGRRVSGQVVSHATGRYSVDRVRCDITTAGIPGQSKVGIRYSNVYTCINAYPASFPPIQIGGNVTGNVDGTALEGSCLAQKLASGGSCQLELVFVPQRPGNSTLVLHVSKGGLYSLNMPAIRTTASE